MSRRPRAGHVSVEWPLRLLRLLALLLLVGAAGAARAHAVVEGTEPTDGAVLAEAPREVVVRFSEPVSVIRAQVLDPTGADLLASTRVAAEDAALRLPLPTSLVEGTFTVSYRVVSLDGHPVGGSLVFSVGRASGAGPSTAPDPADPSAWRWALVTSWAVFYLAVLSAAGGVLFLVLVRPGELSISPTRQVVAVSAALGLAAAVVALGVQGGLLLDGPAESLLELRTWSAGLGSTFGAAALCAIAGLGCILLSVVAAPSRVWDPLGITGAVLALGSFVLTGHVVTAGPGWLTWPLLLTHTGLVAFWVGALVPLHRGLRTPAEQAGPLVERFSRVAVLLVPVLLVTGGLIAVLQVRSAEALLTTAYGRVLLLKLALVSGLMGLAALNRLRLTPALGRGETGAAHHLRRSILAELVLVVTILAATATLGTTPPPRALASGQELTAQASHAHEEHGHNYAHGGLALQLTADSFQADVTLQPGRIGANIATVTLRDPSGEALEVLEVTLRLANSSRGIEPLEREAVQQDLGRWQVNNLTLGIPGEWQLGLDVLISDFVRETAQAALVMN